MVVHSDYMLHSGDIFLPSLSNLDRCSRCSVSSHPHILHAYGQCMILKDTKTHHTEILSSLATMSCMRNTDNVMRWFC